MGKIVSIHSYRGGTGKSNITANLAWLSACEGRRVAVVDTDLQSPGVHMVLDMPRERITHTLSDYLFGRCEIDEAAYQLTPSLPPECRDNGGALYLLPSSMKVESIVRIAAEGYDVGRLNDQFTQLVDELRLDMLLLDTHPGLNRETMLSTAISNVLLLVVRPDAQDFHGTAVLLEVARRLSVPRIHIVGNKVPASLDRDTVRQQIEDAFQRPVLGLLPLSEDFAVLGSRGVFAHKFPDHPVSRELRTVLRGLVDACDSSDVERP